MSHHCTGVVIVKCKMTFLTDTENVAGRRSDMGWLDPEFQCQSQQGRIDQPTSVQAQAPDMEQ